MGFIIVTSIFIVYIFFDIEMIFYNDLFNFPNYLSISSFLGVVFLINLSKISFLPQLLKFLIIISFLLLRARGPLAFLMILLIIYITKYMSFRKKILSFILIILLVIFALNWSGASHTIHRFAIMGSDDYSTYSRELHIVRSMRIISDHFLFGCGIGSYGICANNIDQRYYPHNIFLEVFCESGFIGLIVFLLFLAYVFKLIYNEFILGKQSTNPFILSILYCCLYLFLNAMKSNNFTDNRIFFAWLGILILIITNRKKFENNEDKIS
ncbi:MAG: O-antigen ligase family protein [Candidatus Stygibacter frigidus]|nr:O-antigen ligase family protein [Candidatus Stygibacter frigidus]